MHRTPNRIGLLVSFSLLAQIAVAGANEWTPSGPFGARIRDLVVDPIDPSNLYAAFRHGIFKSTDGGESWTLFDEGIPTNGFDDYGNFPEVVVEVLAIDPTAPDTLYAGTSGPGGIFKSTDGGETWTNVLDHVSVADLVIDPRDASTLYAASELFFHRTSDGGESWETLDLPNISIVGPLAIDPVPPGTLYIADAHGPRLWKSPDGGESWELLALLPGDGRFSKLVVDPATPSTLYAGSDQGIFKSTDGGTTWTASNEGLPDRGITDVVIDPSTASTLYAGTSDGVWKSSDGGRGWTATAASHPRVLALAIDPRNPATVYAGSSGGVWKSADQGESWTASSQGMNRSDPRVLAFDPFDSGILYAGSSTGGVFRSHDGGRTWPTSIAGLAENDVLDLALDPDDPGVLYAAVADGPDVFFKSIDGGETWTSLEDGIADARDFNDLVIDPRRPSRLYAAFRDRLFRSVDHGVTWRRFATDFPGVDALTIDPATSTLYASNRGVFRSTDGGRTWTKSTQGLLFDRGQSVTNFGVLVVDPSDPDVVYGGSNGRGVFKSTDAGTTWTRSTAGLPEGYPVTDLEIDPRDASIVYAAMNGRRIQGNVFELFGVFRSTDAGVSWSRLPDLGEEVRDLALDPRDPSRLLAAAESGLWELVLVEPRPFLELRDGRFHVEVEWGDFQGETGLGIVPIIERTGGVELRSRDSTVVEFFSPENWELLFKVLDGRRLNGHFFVFFAAATDVAFTVTVTDTSCGVVKTWENPLGLAAPAVTDTEAFADCTEPAPPDCTDDADTFCLGEGGRFQVEIAWGDAMGTTGRGRQVLLPGTGLARSDEAGLFYFFSPENWELLVKVLDGCEINGHFWVFGAGTTDVAYTLKVTDTATGTLRIYTNPLGVAANAVTDTEAFATCE